jgi:hypothetical protein
LNNFVVFDLDIVLDPSSKYYVEVKDYEIVKLANSKIEAKKYKGMLGSQKVAPHGPRRSPDCSTITWTMREVSKSGISNSL